MYEITRKSQINVRIIIREPCCHIGQPTVAFILPNIMIKLPVLILNPVVRQYSCGYVETLKKISAKDKYLGVLQSLPHIQLVN